MDRDAAIEVLQRVAQCPAAMAGHAELATALDAIAVVYATNPTDGLTPALRALRSPVATWRTIGAHVELRNRYGDAAR